jgi:hypothetical protein
MSALHRGEGFLESNESLQQTPKAWSFTADDGGNSVVCGFDAAGLLNSMLDSIRLWNFREFG